MYDFIEHVLLDTEIIPKEYIVCYPSLPLRFENILSRIAAYYQYKAIVYLPNTESNILPVQADLLLLDAADPKQWLHLLNEHVTMLTNNSAVAVTGIHKTAEHTAAWKRVCLHAQVRMSIDMYGIGLLLFRQEFKVKQQFILQY